MIYGSNLLQCFSGDGFQKAILAQCPAIRNDYSNLNLISEAVFKNISQALPVEAYSVFEYTQKFSLIVPSLTLISVLGILYHNRHYAAAIYQTLALNRLAVMMDLMTRANNLPNHEINPERRWIHHPDFPGQLLNGASRSEGYACSRESLFLRC